MASINTRLNIEKLDGNIVQKHGCSKQVGFKKLGPSVEIGFHGVQDEKLAQRRLEDKQPEEKTNTDCLVKEREKVHLCIKVGANITVPGWKRISKKRTKNEAKTTKPDTEWKSRKKTKSKSKPKCRKVNPDKPEAKKSRKTSLGTKLVKSLNLFKEEKEEKKEKGPFCQFAKEIPQWPKLPKTTSYTPQGRVVQSHIYLSGTETAKIPKLSLTKDEKCKVSYNLEGPKLANHQTFALGIAMLAISLFSITFAEGMVKINLKEAQGPWMAGMRALKSLTEETQERRAEI
ncbi:hypothetical protein Tco_1072246 [Tanacetum coccineum]